MKDFKIACGNWIYPSRESSTGIIYPIEKPLVVEIYLPKDEQGKQVSNSSKIMEHLSGPRFLNLKLLSDTRISFVSLNNKHEEMFSKLLNQYFDFNPETLARPNDLWLTGKYEGKIVKNPDQEEGNWNSIFFTSILLQIFLNKIKLPDGIFFRDATIAEIESLGRW